MESSDLWEKLKKKFREISKDEKDDVPESNQNVEIRRYPTSDKNIFYVLQKENDQCFQLKFKIELGNHHQDIIDALKDKFPVRDFEYRIYYTAVPYIFEIVIFVLLFELALIVF